MNKQLKLTAIACLALTVPFLSLNAGEKPFPKRVPVLDGSYHEGFAIGKGSTAYSGSPDGSIYKVDLRSGKGDILVAGGGDPLDCLKLGMRVDPRTNYLFVAGCVYGNALVFDADTGELIMEYQLAPAFEAIINDLTITKDAVYFTDSFQPFLYKLPLSKNGGIPTDPNAGEAIPLSGDFVTGDDFYDGFCCAANGIVSTPNGKTLIVGNSSNSTILRVDPATGHADEIMVDTPLIGFLDGLVFRDNILYVLTPYDPTPEDMIQVVLLDKDLLNGQLLGTITDPDLDGVASGALFGNSLYVNAARYSSLDDLTPDTPFWITKLSIFAVE